MAKKLFAVFLMCMVVLAAVNVHKAEATDDQQFKDCYNNCHKECFQDGQANGYTFCEMKCDADCAGNTIKTTFGGLLS